MFSQFISRFKIRKKNHEFYADAVHRRDRQTDCLMTLPARYYGDRVMSSTSNSCDTGLLAVNQNVLFHCTHVPESVALFSKYTCFSWPANSTSYVPTINIFKVIDTRQGRAQRSCSGSCICLHHWSATAFQEVVSGQTVDRQACGMK